MWMLWLASLGLFVTLVGVVFVGRRITNYRIRRTFEAISRRFGLMGHFARKAGPTLQPVAMGTLGGHLTRIESAFLFPSRRAQPVTRFTVTRGCADRFDLALRRNPTGKKSGEAYVTSGEPTFDQKILLKTNDEERARRILDHDLRASLLACVELGMCPPGIQVSGDRIAYTEDDLLTSDRQRRLAEAMIQAMLGLADRLDGEGSPPSS